jgi:uncharacterized protein (DUF362 family)
MRGFASRRSFLQIAGVSAAAAPFAAAQDEQLMQPRGVYTPEPVVTYDQRAKVSLVQGESRRKNISTALEAIEDQVLAGLKTRKYVLIKPVGAFGTRPLASTHVDALHGILDFLAPRFSGPVYVGETSNNVLGSFENLAYNQLADEHKPRQVNLIDLSQEGAYVTDRILSGDLHVEPVRLAARLFDPDAYVLSVAAMKTHNAVLVTLAVKNIILGGTLQNAPNETPRWNDRRRYHGGVRQLHFNIMLTAQKMRPFWGAAVIDGYEGMEGNGPVGGTPVPSRVAIASTDFVAADRIAVETMGVDPSWVGYLQFCWQVGLGQYDRSKIDVVGADPAAVIRKYRLHRDIEPMLEWIGPLTDVPPQLG